MAISACGLWNPYARLVSTRRWVLAASTRALVVPVSRVFQIRSRNLRRSWRAR
jgi:hypothetical protein